MSLTVVLTILVMVVLTAVFAAYELALVSVRIGRLKSLVEQKRRGAALALRMKERMEGSLAVAQLGMTVSAMIAAATGGASVEEKLSPWIVTQLGVSNRVADILALICVVVPLSALTVVIGELVPKVLAIKNPEWVCTTLSPGMWVFGKVIYPAVVVLEWLTTTLVELVERLLPHRKTDDAQAGLHELRAQVN